MADMSDKEHALKALKELGEVEATTWAAMMTARDDSVKYEEDKAPAVIAYRLLQDARQHYAHAAGAGDRLRKLRKLDEDYFGPAEAVDVAGMEWPLGSFLADGLTTDDGMHGILATWLFDCVGRNPATCVYGKDEDEVREIEKAAAKLAYGIVAAAVGAEHAAAAFAQWKAGRHDT